MKEMRGVRLYIVVVFLFVCAGAQSQVVRRRNTNWIFPREQDEVYRTNNYEITERSCSNDEWPLCVFIKRDFDKKPILFYMHHRSVDATLGHRQQLVLINDYFSTKLVKVVVVNLKSGVNAEIDRRALAMYRRHVKPDHRLWIVAEAYEFSPDDRKVPMRMVGDDVSAATAQESIEASRTYKDWWYSVNSQTGRVLCEFRTNRIRQKWW